MIKTDKYFEDYAKYCDIADIFNKYKANYGKVFAVNWLNYQNENGPDLLFQILSREDSLIGQNARDNMVKSVSEETDSLGAVYALFDICYKYGDIANCEALQEITLCRLLKNLSKAYKADKQNINSSINLFANALLYLARAGLASEFKFYQCLFAAIKIAKADSHALRTSIFAGVNLKPALPAPFKKVAFLFTWAGSMAMHAPLITHLGPKLVDIVVLFAREQGGEALKEFETIGFNIKYGKEHLHEYDLFICELHQSYGVPISKPIIMISHSIDDFAWGYAPMRASLCLLAAAGFAKAAGIALEDGESAYVPTSLNLCPLVATGPYHLDTYRNLTKSDLKELIQEKYGFPVTSLPYVLVLEDLVSPYRSLVRLVNYIAKFATVILKPIKLLDHRNYLGMVDKNVLVIKNKILGNNLLRHAADFIICSYKSGSIVSSVLLGTTPVLAYCHRMVKDKSERFRSLIPETYTNLIMKDCDPLHILGIANPAEELTAFLHKQNKIFDIVRLEPIRHAILGSEYTDWFHSNLHIMQSFFGSYSIEDASKQSAKIIMEFIKTGGRVEQMDGLCFASSKDLEKMKQVLYNKYPAMAGKIRHNAE